MILIPSTYFIDLNGVAIEIIGGSVDDQNVLFDKIKKTIEVFKQSLPSNDSQNHNRIENNKNTENTSNNSANNEVTTSATTSATTSETCESIGSTSNATESASIERKVERANLLIEAIREKKAKEEAEKERAEETERRKGMKEMQNSKRLREEKEALEIIEQREREKKEERLARERVLAQIAADREERKKREIQFTDKQNSEQNIVKSNTNDTEVRQRVVNDKTRIQFRLPDGSTANNIFEANDTLETVGQYVSSHFNIRSFVLSTTFPRKEFSTEEYCKTLEELSLCPSSVLLVIPKTGTNISGTLTSPSILWQIVTYLSLPFVMIWNLMTTFFNRSNRMDTNTEDTTRQKPQKKDQKTFYNRDGNIARMRDRMNDSDDSDDNNTWNGNSTQQM